MDSQKQAQPTAGPWTHEGRLVWSPDGMICEISEPRASRFVQHFSVAAGSPDFREAMANGKLIAAAQDLLAACKDALICNDQEVGHHEQCGWCEQAIGHSSNCFIPGVKAAVAKAEGRDA